MKIEAMQAFTAPSVAPEMEEEQVKAQQMELPFHQQAKPEEPQSTAVDRERIERVKQMEEVMQKGMQFLAGMYRMSTGKEMDVSKQKIEVDEKTGEVVMRFSI